MSREVELYLPDGRVGSFIVRSLPSSTFTVSCSTTREIVFWLPAPDSLSVRGIRLAFQRPLKAHESVEAEIVVGSDRGKPAWRGEFSVGDFGRRVSPAVELHHNEAVALRLRLVTTDHGAVDVVPSLIGVLGGPLADEP